MGGLIALGGLPCGTERDSRYAGTQEACEGNLPRTWSFLKDICARQEHKRILSPGHRS